MGVDSYGANIVACLSQFNNTVLSQTNCTSNAGVWWKGNAPSATSLAPMIAVVLLLVV